MKVVCNWMQEAEEAPIRWVLLLHKVGGKVTQEELGVKRQRVEENGDSKQCCRVGSWKIIIKFLSNIKRPVEGSVCELTVVSVFFVVLSQVFGYWVQELRRQNKKIFFNWQAKCYHRAGAGFRVHARKRLNWRVSEPMLERKEVKTGGGCRVEGEWTGNPNEMRWQGKWEHLSKWTGKLGKQ